MGRVFEIGLKKKTSRPSHGQRWLVAGPAGRGRRMRAPFQAFEAGRWWTANADWSVRRWAWSDWSWPTRWSAPSSSSNSSRAPIGCRCCCARATSAVRATSTSSGTPPTTSTSSTTKRSAYHHHHHSNSTGLATGFLVSKEFTGFLLGFQYNHRPPPFHHQGQGFWPGHWLLGFNKGFIGFFTGFPIQSRPPPVQYQGRAYLAWPLASRLQYRVYRVFYWV